MDEIFLKFLCLIIIQMKTSNSSSPPYTFFFPNKKPHLSLFGFHTKNTRLTMTLITNKLIYTHEDWFMSNLFVPFFTFLHLTWVIICFLLFFSFLFTTSHGLIKTSWINSNKSTWGVLIMGSNPRPRDTDTPQRIWSIHIALALWQV